MNIRHKIIVSNDIIKLFSTNKDKSKEYERRVNDIINLSKDVFPEKFKYNEKQSRGECDYVGLASGKKYDAKIPFESKQIRLLTDGKLQSPQINEWLKQLSDEASDFSPLKLREDPNYSVTSTKLYKIMREQLLKDKPDEDIIYFIPFPIVIYFADGTQFLNQASNYLNIIYETMKNENILLNRKIYVILPSSEKNIWTLVDLEKRIVEFIEYSNLEEYISYEMM